MIQAKEDFILVFPKGMCGEKTIKVHVSPFSVRNVVKQILESQELVFGTICVVQDFYGSVMMIACRTESKGIKFFTEDDDVEQIKETEDK